MQSWVNINKDFNGFRKIKTVFHSFDLSIYRDEKRSLQTFNRTDDTAGASPKCQTTPKQNCSCWWWYYLVLPLSILAAFIAGTIVEKNANLIKYVSNIMRKWDRDRGM